MVHRRYGICSAFGKFAGFSETEPSKQSARSVKHGKHRHFVVRIPDRYNVSPATETISRISLITKNGKVYHSKNITEKQDTQFLQFSNQDNFEVDTDKILLITPIVLKPFSFTFGCDIFFNSVLTHGETLTLQFDRVSWFKHPIIKSVIASRNFDDKQSN